MRRTKVIIRSATGYEALEDMVNSAIAGAQRDGYEVVATQIDTCPTDTDGKWITALVSMSKFDKR